MSKGGYKRTWGTAGWLDDHEFGAAGATRCQRKTKTYECVHAAVGDVGFIKAVFRQKRNDGDLCAAFLKGQTSKQAGAFSWLNNVTWILERAHSATFACVTSFTYDYPSGCWQALVIFKRRAK